MSRKRSAASIQLSKAQPVLNFWGDDFDLDLPVFGPLEDVVGSVFVTVGKRGKVEFGGIKLELVGKIEVKGKQTEGDFVYLARELAYPGTITADSSFPFSFSTCEKPFDSYYGTFAKVRYFLRVCVSRSYRKNLLSETEFAVASGTPPLPLPTTLRLEVGIDQLLHIDFEFTNCAYSLTDCIIGKVFFLMVRLPIHRMDIVLKRKETLYNGSETQIETQTMGRYEVMDGEPRRGECVPVRVFLSSFPLSPTFPDVNHRFSVKYYLSLVVADDTDRKFFKQAEIQLYRG